MSIEFSKDQERNEAENGERALDKVVSTEIIHKIDLLISDIVMPEMGGEELANHVREIRPDLKILLCSGYTDSRISIKDFSDRNGYFFLPKPYTIKRLEKTIRFILSSADQISAK